MDIKQFAKGFIAHDNNEDQLEWGRRNSSHFSTKQFLQAMAEIDTIRRASRVKEYLYMVTFTIDPKKHPVIDDKLEEKIVRLIESQPERKALQCREASMVKELHKSGRPHWHLKLLTTKALRSDAFTQFVKVYGNVDISRTKTYKSPADALHMDIYMSKEGDVKVLLPKDSGHLTQEESNRTNGPVGDKSKRSGPIANESDLSESEAEREETTDSEGHDPHG